MDEQGGFGLVRLWLSPWVGLFLVSSESFGVNYVFCHNPDFLPAFVEISS